MIDEAAAIADVHIADEYKDMMMDSLNSLPQSFEAIYGLHIPNQVAPAVVFDPVPAGMKLENRRQPQNVSAAPKMSGVAPKNLEDVAFYSVRQLAELVLTKKVSSAALTEMYLERLKRYDPVLKFVITLTEDRAQAQAKEADREIAAETGGDPRAQAVLPSRQRRLVAGEHIAVDHEFDLISSFGVDETRLASAKTRRLEFFG